MKKRYLVGLISALMIVGCGSNGNSSNNSSILNNSNSSTSSSTIDTTGWIANGDESFAINNPNSWVYSVDDNVKTTLAMENEGELYFYYNKSGTVSWNSAQLFYHSSSLKVGNGYNVVLSLSSSIAGKITINGEVVEIKEGLNDLTISSVLEENKSAISQMVLAFKQALNINIKYKH